MLGVHARRKEGDRQDAVPDITHSLPLITCPTSWRTTKEQHCLPGCLALHTSSRELEVTSQFFARWNAIFSAFPYVDCEVLARGTGPKFDAPHMEEEIELMGQGKTDCQALYLSRLDEF